MTGAPLRLSDAVPFAEGARRSIYRHPDHPDRVVKIDKAWTSRRKARPLKRLKHALLPPSDMRHARAEPREALAVAERAARLGGRAPIPAFHGLVETDLGTGAVHQLIAGPDGLPAPTLLRVLDGAPGVAPPLRLALDVLFAALLDQRVIVNDLHRQNVVVAGPDDRPEAWLIDGYGQRALIPLSSWSARVQAAKLQPKISALARKIGLTWDPKARQLADIGREPFAP